MLVVVCFCVFGLVIFIVIMVVIGLVVWCGWLFCGGDVIEIVVGLEYVVFDKIGIFILGCFFVIDVYGDDLDYLL